MAGRGPERDKTAESCQPHRGSEELLQIWGVTPGLRKPYLMTDDEGYMRGGLIDSQKTELNLIGQGFVSISEGICQRLFTQLNSSPASPPQEAATFSKQQKNKPGILAPRSEPPNFVQITISTQRSSEETQLLSCLP